LRDFQRLGTEKHYFGGFERASLRKFKSSFVVSIYSRYRVPKKPCCRKHHFALLRTLKILLRQNESPITLKRPPNPCYYKHYSRYCAPESSAGAE